jgi:hypothetical protein
MESKAKILIVEDNESQRLLCYEELKETIQNLFGKKRKGVKPTREEVEKDESVKRKKT